MAQRGSLGTRLTWSINDTAVLGTTRTWPIRAGRARPHRPDRRLRHGGTLALCTRSRAKLAAGRLAQTSGLTLQALLAAAATGAVARSPQRLSRFPRGWASAAAATRLLD